MRPKAADLTPSKRGASQPPFSFRRRSRHGASAPRRKCGVRRREPLCGATGVYSIKRGPRCAARSGEQRERAAGAVQERTRQGEPRMSATPEDEDGPLDPQSRHFCGNAVRHRIAGRARFASAASAAQDGGSSRNGATRVHPIGVPAAHSAAGNGTMFPRKPLLFGRGLWLGKGTDPLRRRIGRAFPLHGGLARGVKKPSPPEGGEDLERGLDLYNNQFLLTTTIPPSSLAV